MRKNKNIKKLSNKHSNFSILNLHENKISFYNDKNERIKKIRMKIREHKRDLKKMNEDTYKRDILEKTLKKLGKSGKGHRKE
jgi:thermostable 8-oxoguanine DNA glycosylase